MYRSTDPRQRTIAALASGLLITAIATMLVLGLRLNLSAPRLPSLVAISLERPAPAPAPPPPPARSRAPTGAPSPANLRNRASPVIAVPNPLPSTPIVAETHTWFRRLSS